MARGIGLCSVVSSLQQFKAKLEQDYAAMLGAS
jgi:hypothetical protein